MRILVSGMIAGDPYQGGASWAVLQYVLGLERLGHEVAFVEPMSATRAAAAEPYFRLVLAGSGLSRAALLVQENATTVGSRYEDVRTWFMRADLLLNFAGLLTDESLLESIPLRVYVDLDPAFSQLWHIEGVEMRFAGHTHYVTVGQAVGQDACPIPSCGVEWIPTVPPVVLERWPVADAISHDALTTVCNWRSYGSIEHDGVFYGQKAHSLRNLMELPTRTDERLVLALAIDPAEQADLAELDRQKWGLVNPARVAGTPATYAAFIRGSKAEFGLAKSGYVLSRSGWFSDRSVCYLASGRPVVAQDTGFGAFIDCGAGLLSFATVDDAVAAIEELRSDYRRHSRAARALAEEHFDSDRVLTSLLEGVGAA
jgi:glycosyltransferase involved in cell wall biosynthesis